MYSHSMRTCPDGLCEFITDFIDMGLGKTHQGISSVGCQLPWESAQDGLWDEEDKGFPRLGWSQQVLCGPRFPPPGARECGKAHLSGPV